VAAKDPIQLRLGHALRSVRAERGLTQEQLSEAAGLHPTYISDIERGARNPSWKALVQLCAGLGVPTAALAVAYDETSSGNRKPVT
jgi:transcriptional regulator with XRE-family HTH domain